MKKMYFLFAMLMLAGTSMVSAQTTVQVNAGVEWLGFANVFETPGNGGAFVFGSAWGVPDLKTVVDAPGGTVTLQPNFNTWDPADPFWVTPGGEANKVFEGNTYYEDLSLIGSEVTWTGGVQSNTIAAGYDVVAFIKVFNADFSVLKEETTPLVAGQNFSVTYTDVAPEDTFIQLGFKVTGLIADPADEAALGSVVIQDTLLSTGDVNSIQATVYPNPVTNMLNVQAADQITSITIYDVLGQQVLALTPNTNSVSTDVSQLGSGVYITSIQTAEGSKTVKLVKK